MKQGHIFIIAGPSGVGKNSVIKELVTKHSGLVEVLSYTTRPQRHDDYEHKNRITISRAKFNQLINKRELADWAEIHGQLYGKKKLDLKKALHNGKNVIIEIDVQGLIPYKKQFPNIISFFLKYHSMTDMLVRLKHTHPDMSQEEINRRIQTARTEMKSAHLFNYQIITINGQSPHIVALEIEKIIKEILAKQTL
ncbi:MAG: hypothetical protein Q7S37_01755 [bacterium]|nr:hypothetical protein [bacterium]